MKNATKTKPAPAATVNTSERLMITRLGVSQWYPRRFDRKASDELARLHGKQTADDVGRFNKILIELESLKPLQRAVADLKTEHYRMTAPWTDDGARVLPVDLYFGYVEMVRDRAQTIRTLSSDFAGGEYAEQIKLAEKRLGGLFKREDYPTPDDVEGRFTVRQRFEPLPNPEDVRVWGVGEKTAREIEKQVRADVTEAIDAAHKHVVDQVLKQAQGFVEKVARYHEGDTKTLFETAVENLRDVVQLVLQGLNVTGDQELKRTAGALVEALADVNVEKLRTGSELRVAKMREVDQIASRFAGVYGRAK